MPSPHTPHFWKWSRLTLVLAGVLWCGLLIGQQRDSTYFAERYLTQIRLKNNQDTSIFAYTDELLTEIKAHPEFAYRELDYKNTLANYYYRTGQFQEALERYDQIHREAALREDSVRFIQTLESKANVYQYLGEHQKVIENFSRGYDFWMRKGKIKLAARSARNLAETYTKMEQYDEALSNIHNAIAIYDQLQDSSWLAESFHTRADNLIRKFKQQNNLSDNYIQALIALKTSDHYLSDIHKMESRYVLGNNKLLRAEIAYHRGEFEKAAVLIDEAIDILNDFDFDSKNRLAEAHLLAAHIYEDLDQIATAIENITRYSAYADSLQVFYANELAVENEVKLSIKNKQAEGAVLAEAEKERLEQEHAAHVEQQTFYGIIGVSILLIMMVVLVITIHRKRQLKRLFLQLAEKTKDLTDSIHYAERIQRSMLPGEEQLDASFKSHFVLYKPKDIVAGDFYWMAEYEGYTYLAVADCTGHGVPGAMVSMVCHEALQRALLEYQCVDTNDLLHKARELVKERFSQSLDGLVKDGMDIALCRIDHTRKKVQFTGANNPLWLLRNQEMIIVKGDRQPVGSHYAEKDFTAHEIMLDHGDRLYMFSDGYADQFGGEKGKKFRSGKLKTFITETGEERLPKQKQELDTCFEAWRQDFEQVDDVCIIGITPQ